MEYCILVVNPGSTSTKIAVFQGEGPLQKNHPPQRGGAGPLCRHHGPGPLPPSVRGGGAGGLRPDHPGRSVRPGRHAAGLPSRGLRRGPGHDRLSFRHHPGAHASNLGCVMARDLAEPLHIPAYVYDPVAVDEMPPMARITGIPELPRRMMGHALNTRAMAIRCAETVLHKPL